MKMRNTIHEEVKGLFLIEVHKNKNGGGLVGGKEEPLRACRIGIRKVWCVEYKEKGGGLVWSCSEDRRL